ncbi:MAG: hypothetical protein Q9161_008068 [Pseudevernia consocians]
MNVQQLGTGHIHIGFFFLTAILAGGLGVLLATSVKPVERALLRARERLAHNLSEPVEDIQRREILRQSSLGQRILNAMTVPDNDVVSTYVIGGLPLEELWHLFARIVVLENNTVLRSPYGVNGAIGKTFFSVQNGNNIATTE